MREKDGYREALEKIRSYGYGELLTPSQVAEIAFKNSPNPRAAKTRAIHYFSGWVGNGRGKTLPSTSLARQIC